MTNNQDKRQVSATGLAKKSSGKIWIWPLLLIAIVALVWGVMHYQASQKASANLKSDARSRPVPVSVATAVKRDINVYQDALGTVTSRNSVTVKARVDGQLLNLYFREGQMVKAGDLLAQIDPRPFEVQLAQVSAQLAKDKALLENTQIDLERYKTLLAQDSISKQQADTQESLVRQYHAALAVDQAQVDNAKLQLSYARIMAPISGRVGLRQVDPGNMIHSSDTNGIVTITQLQPITVLFNIPEDDLPAVTQHTKTGTPLQVEAFDRGQKLKLASGNLLTSDNQIDTTTGTIKLRAEFKNDDATLFPNQFVNIKMLVDVQKEAVVVPVAAIQRGRNGDYAYVIVNNESVRLQPVKVGNADGESVSILSGLNIGDMVVTDGADKLRDGAKVKLAVPRNSAAGGSDATEKPGGKAHNREGARHQRSAS
ncbi:MAG TPA: MdtA/MuxA family multidrug efflux RND transporter periplasmic adaptor subunit [Methylophilaceae bacterium]|jgi:multidrug efflux system membrane fusion protein